MPSLRNRHLLLIDAILLSLAVVLAFLARFEGWSWPARMEPVCIAYLLLSVPLKLAVMWRMGVYSRLWRYASVAELQLLIVSITAAGMMAGAVGLALAAVPGVDQRVPFSVIILDVLLAGGAVTGLRFLVRVRRLRVVSPETRRRALVAGAGAAGSMIIRELLENPQLGLSPVAIVDDDPSKAYRLLHGIPVTGRLTDIAEVCQRLSIDEVIIAMPTVPGLVIRDIVQRATEAGVPTRTVPGLFELLDGRKSVSALRKVAIEDLLRRSPVTTDLVKVETLATDKVVMVTGAGGSIGAELCRQIAHLRPRRIIAVGRGENSVFELLQELRVHAPSVAIEPVIADVRDRARMERVFEAYRPSTVFHAAAHKHVPLMEANVGEAVLNNVLGTQVVAGLAAAHGVERFVLISSDKAVRPSSVMGATKRLAEGVVQRYAGLSRRSFVSVRFGNVLGSRGSVVPTFLRQIQAGGPVMVTHPEMRRFFMTIPEAVQLVLQAGAMGEAGEVFVLDMGEPVKVLDLARDLIRLSGLEEGRDIEIRFTGVRPGEKLYEELFFGAESATPTSHSKILRARNAALRVDGAFSVDDLIALAARNAPPEEIRRGIKRLVPEFTGHGAAEPVEAPTPLVAHAAAAAPRPDRGERGTHEPERESPRPERTRTPATPMPAAGMAAGPARGSAQRLSV